MFSHNLTIACRNALRNKGYSLINITGLATGITCCVLILLYVLDELDFDAFHTKADRVYRLLETRSSPDHGDRRFPSTMGPVGPALIAEFPEFSAAARIRSRMGIGRMAIRRGDDRFYIGDELVVEPSFFQIFDFPFTQGDPAQALKNPGSVVLTETAARKYYADQNPVGQTLETDRFGRLTVTGIMKDPPPNSHLTWSMLVSFATLESNPRWKEYIESWSSENFITYLLARQPLDITEWNQKLASFVERHHDAMPKTLRSIELQPLRDIHFGSADLEFDTNEHKGERTYVSIFALLALFILLIACINYVNLATGYALKRTREIALRKVVGAHRHQLVIQFLIETFLLIGVAFGFALVLVEIALPSFNSLAGKNLALSLSVRNGLVPALCVLFALVGIASGAYPSWALARIPLAAALKGGRKRGAAPLRSRQALVVAQFVLSITMIIATISAYRQMEFIRAKHLGFNQDALVVVDINSGSTRRSFQAIKSDIASLPSVTDVTVSSRVPGDWKNIDQIDVVPGEPATPQEHTAFFMCIDTDFLHTFQMRLVEGRNLLAEMGTDTASVLVNETAARTFGWEHPIGKEIHVQGYNYSPRIVGVVHDFSFESLHQKIAPLVLGHWNNPVTSIDYFTVRVRSADLAQTLNALKKIHERFDQTTPFEFNFLDDRLKDFYQADMRMGKIFALSAGMAIMIACMGVLGLVTFSAQQRTREIGVRKVLGASEGQIVYLLSKEYSHLVILATLLASPIAYLAVERWLSSFAYRVDIGWATFLLAGICALLLSLLTVGYQAIRAAAQNPAVALRYE